MVGVSAAQDQGAASVSEYMIYTISSIPHVFVEEHRGYVIYHVYPRPKWYYFVQSYGYHECHARGISVFDGEFWLWHQHGSDLPPWPGITVEGVKVKENAPLRQLFAMIDKDSLIVHFLKDNANAFTKLLDDIENGKMAEGIANLISKSQDVEKVLEMARTLIKLALQV